MLGPWPGAQRQLHVGHAHARTHTCPGAYDLTSRRLSWRELSMSKIVLKKQLKTLRLLGKRRLKKDL